MPGEWLHCDGCGELVDTEKWPDGFYIAGKDGKYYCERCVESMEEYQYQWELDREAARMRQAEINAIKRR